MVTDMGNTKKRKKRIAFLLIVVLLVCSIGATVWIYHFDNRQTLTNLEEEDYHTITYQNEKYRFNTSIISILLLGIDTTDPEYEQGQADVLELLLLDRTNKTIQIVTIPRDTMTEIKTYDISGNSLGWHQHHINLAYAYANDGKSGCMRTMQAVSRMMNGIPIIHYAALNLNMLTEVQNIVGSLEITLPNDSLTEVDWQWYEGNTIEVNADNVETYLRTRDTTIEFSNESRMERQKSYMKAYFQELKNLLAENFEETVQKIYSVCQQMTTNLSYSDLEIFANMMLEYEFDENQNFYVLEGENKSGELHDEFYLNAEKLKAMIIQLFYLKED